jgi:hypothetical protein
MEIDQDKAPVEEFKEALKHVYAMASTSYYVIEASEKEYPVEMAKPNNNWDDACRNQLHKAHQSLMVVYGVIQEMEKQEEEISIES